MSAGEDGFAFRPEFYELALRYARGADRRDYAAVGALFVADGRIVGRRGAAATAEPLYLMEGREAIVAGLRGLERFEKTSHLVANQLVVIKGDTATGETYCTAHHIYREDGAARNLSMAIRYQDRFAKEGGDWRFAERVLVIDWERDQPLGEKGWV